MNQSFSTTRGQINIREVNPTDAMSFRELRLYALQESPVAFSADYQKNLNHPPEHWEDMLTMHEDESTIFVAIHENQLIGMTGIARGGSPKTRHVATIWGVYVRPEWRGLRIADALIEACIEWAKSNEVIVVKLGVTSASTAAIRCYQRCGFTISGTEPRGLFYEGQYYDGYLMYRSLDNS